MGYEKDVGIDWCGGGFCALLCGVSCRVLICASGIELVGELERNARNESRKISA